LWSPYKLDGEPEGAAVFGDKGYVVVGNSRWQAHAPDGKVVAQGGSSNTDHDKAHKQNFIDCIKSGRRPNCDIEIGHLASTLCHLGNIAWRVGRTLEFDPKAGAIVGDDQANALARRSYRKPWVLPDPV